MAKRPLSRWTAILFSALAIALANGAAHSAGETKVIASFSILADMARQVGGDRVEVVGLVGPEEDAHEYQPTPADAKKVANAKLLVVNGLGFEGWMARLQQSSGFKGHVVTASKGITALVMEEGGGGKPKKVTDPHAWQSLANGRIYIGNVRDGLIEADPEGRQAYEANATKLLAAIDELEPKVKAAIESIPAGRRKIITSHDAFGYFADAYGMRFLAPQGVSTESDPSAADVARIIRQIRTQKIPAVFIENITDKRLLEQIVRETGARIGGTLYSDALSKAGGPAATYLDMFRHNVETLRSALSS